MDSLCGPNQLLSLVRALRGRELAFQATGFGSLNGFDRVVALRPSLESPRTGVCRSGRPARAMLRAGASDRPKCTRSVHFASAYGERAHGVHPAYHWLFR